MRNCKFFIFLFGAGAMMLFFTSPFCVCAAEIESINIDSETVEKGYTVGFSEDKLKLSLVPGVLTGATRVEGGIVEENRGIPWKLERISPVYQFDFADSSRYDHGKPFYIQVSYEENGDHKQVFFYDSNAQGWRPLPTRDFPGQGFVRSLIHLPFARLAVFANSDVPISGKASWYAYKGGNFAASPDFPQGSRLRVFNSDSGEFVDVEINDYGPDRSIHPERVVDLDKMAFAKIADLGEGVVDVHIRPLYIPGDDKYKIAGLDKNGGIASIYPDIGSEAALIIDQEDNKIIHEKNADKIMYLASLTKLVALYVFLEQNIDMDKIVEYKEQDENYNYEHCNKWESARVRLDEGEQVKVRDLVYSALTGSANNAVESLVRVSGLERNEFIAEMNGFAASVGADSAYFDEPSGLSVRNRATPRDFLKISQAVFENDIIKDATTIRSYDFTTIDTEEEHTIKNTNPFISNNIIAGELDGFTISGAKTGYLHEAGHCLVMEFKAADNDLIAIVMGAETGAERIEDMENLIKYGEKTNTRDQ